MERVYINKNTDLMKEWDWEKNTPLDLFPDKLKCGSNKKVWWKCFKCNFEWQATPNNRSSGTKCPFCTNKILIKGKNDLQTLYPQIASKWNYALNKDSPNTVFPHSCKKVWWICSKDKRHIFEARIDHMVNGEIICPICSNQKIIIGINDLATTNPHILKEWNYKKNKITPQQVTYGTNKKVWWVCDKGHEWQAIIASRAGIQKTGCPYCKNELRVSIPEKCLSYYLSKYYEVEENKHFDWLNKYELDIYVPELHLAIEYDGRQWHKDIKRDQKKDSLCLKNNLTLIRIREEGCPRYNSNVHMINVAKNKNIVVQLKGLIEKTFNYINKKYKTTLCCRPDIEKDYTTILNKTLSLQKEKNVANSDLMKEWNYGKNANINASMLSLGMHKKVWWICSKGHEWQAMIYSRASGVGCPYCAGQKVLSGENDLQTLYPNIAKEWDYKKNGNTKPNQIRPKTNKVYWWICPKCNNEWKTAVSHRTEGKGCPKCARKLIISSHFKKIINIDTGITYESIISASKALNIGRGSLSLCLHKKTKTAGGYHWSFL